jgi:hypothetical protein
MASCQPQRAESFQHAPGTAAALPLVEGRALDPSLVNGVAPEGLTLGAGGDATMRFVDEVAAFQNALGSA